MSLQIFSKNMKYLRKKQGLKPAKLVQTVNAIIRKEFEIADDKFINVQRLNAYENKRSYCPAYLLPILCRVLRVKDPLQLFTTDIEQLERRELS